MNTTPLKAQPINVHERLSRILGIIWRDFAEQDSLMFMSCTLLEPRALPRLHGKTVCPQCNGAEKLEAEAKIPTCSNKQEHKEKEL